MNRADLLALFYCGSTKSLATGLPMAGILFAGQDISLIVLPLMLFHLIQLVICALISQRYAVPAVTG
jgi:sodium/bile acid cotransporter 7